MICTFDFDGEGGGLAASFIGHLHLVESSFVRSDVLEVESRVPRVRLNRGLDAARRQRSSVKEPLGSWVRMGGEVDVDVDARSRPTTQHVVQSLVILQHWQFCHKHDTSRLITLLTL